MWSTHWFLGPTGTYLPIVAGEQKQLSSAVSNALKKLFISDYWYQDPRDESRFFMAGFLIPVIAAGQKQLSSAVSNALKLFAALFCKIRET